MPTGRASAVWMDARPDTVEEHLAVDEALLEEAHEGVRTETVVRAWMADSPVVVVGSSSRIEQEVDRSACDALGVRIVRRPSGGATVVLGPGCLMWTVVVPHPEGAPAIERIHADTLGPLRAELATAMAADGAAVERRGSSDLVILRDGQALKVSGNALRVRRNGVLYHGTLLDAFDLGLVGRVLRHPPREPDYRAGRPHADFLANLRLGRAALEGILRPRSRRATRSRPLRLRRVDESPLTMPIRPVRPPRPLPVSATAAERKRPGRTVSPGMAGRSGEIRRAVWIGETSCDNVIPWRFNGRCTGRRKVRSTGAGRWRGRENQPFFAVGSTVSSPPRST
ncbi:MAG: hypothetical protein EBZ59_10095 [Planctomycetia bacterium]|nr:hypothetical protein [Planctomycetia bacterium]